MQPFSTVPLSAQQLIDCDRANQGCAGGWPDYAWSYVTTNTLLTSTEYPYMAANGDSCYASPPSGQSGSIAGFQYVPSQSEVSLREVGVGVTKVGHEAEMHESCLVVTCSAPINLPLLIWSWTARCFKSGTSVGKLKLMTRPGQAHDMHLGEMSWGFFSQFPLMCWFGPKLPVHHGQQSQNCCLGVATTQHERLPYYVDMLISRHSLQKRYLNSGQTAFRIHNNDYFVILLAFLDIGGSCGGSLSCMGSIQAPNPSSFKE